MRAVWPKLTNVVMMILLKVPSELKIGWKSGQRKSVVVGSADRRHFIVAQNGDHLEA